MPWLVGAAEEPPAVTQPLGSAFVLITKVRDLGVRKPTTGGICATAKTRKQSLLDDDPDTASVDPWHGGQDPWSLARQPAEAVSQPRSDAKPAGAGASKSAEIEACLRSDFNELKTQLQSDVAASSAEAPESSQRLHALESGLTEMRHQNAKFEEWFVAFGTKVNDQATALSALQNTVKDQQQELAKNKGEMQATISQAVGTLQKDLSAQVSGQLQNQFEQIQALFSDQKARNN